MKGRIFGVGGVIAALISLMFMGRMMEVVDGSELVRIQGIGGGVKWVSTPGPTWQGLGSVTRYQRRGTITFHEADGVDHRLPMKFNDNGRALIKGQVNYGMPTDPTTLEELYKNFPSEEILVARLVQPALNKSIFLTGNVMTSYESYKEKRSMMIQLVEDQTEHGVYQTRTQEREIDEETLNTAGLPVIVKKKVTEVQIVTANGQPVRAEEGQLARFGVTIEGFAVEDIDYDDNVDKQIQEQQQITMSVQTSIAKAKQAIQEAVTAEATGRANIATERAKREIEKTAAVVGGEQLRDVAKLAAEEAGYYKTEQLLRADADSEYKRRVMAADGALTQKLDTYEKVQTVWADAFSKFKGQIVPSVVTGNTGATSGGNAMSNLMEMLGAKAAMDLGLSLRVSHQQQ